jgi:predicted Zn-dependent protease
MKRKRNLGLERLEIRDTPAVFGLPWVDAQHVTLSFAPDGTKVSGVGSNLFGHMQADGLSTSAWQGQILKAVQSWTSQANFNVGVVSDSGAALGTAGLSQGDTRFGDIRVSMRALDTSVLAITSPPGNSTDTSGGDIIFNSNYHFSVGAKAGSYDLYSVAVHELGHSLGLGDGTDTTSVMFENYNGVRTGLSTGDVTTIDAMYGVRPADANQLVGTPTTASGTAIPASGTNTLLVRGNMTAGSTDLFQFTVPDKMDKGTTVLFRSQGVSLLAADVTIVDNKGKVVGAATSNGQAGVFLSVTPKLKSNQTYYVSVTATAGTTFNVGAYKLAVSFGGNSSGDNGGEGGDGKAIVTTYDPTMASLTQTYFSDRGTNETFATATTLQGVAGTTSQAHYSQFALLTGTTDVDFYKVQSPASATGTTNLLVSVRSMSVGLPPVLQFTDANGNLLQVQQLSGTASARTYQISGVAAGATFGIQVTSPGVLGAAQYNLQVDFVANAIAQTTAGSGTLGTTNTTAFHTLVINEPQTISFNFLATADGLASPTTMWVQLFDSAGNTVSLWMVQTGMVATESLLLQPGEYTLKIWGAFAAGSTAVDYSLGLTTMTDPIGIALIDPTLSTSTTTTAAPVVVVPPSPFQFFTYNPSYYAWLVTPLS